MAFRVLAILDTKPLTSGSLPPNECARPYLHEFLEAVYPHYDSKSSYSCFCHARLNEFSMHLVRELHHVESHSCHENNYRSQTSWIWLETKLVELGMVGSDKNYHVRTLDLLAH